MIVESGQTKVVVPQADCEYQFCFQLFLGRIVRKHQSVEAEYLQKIPSVSKGEELNIIALRCLDCKREFAVV